MTYPVRIFGRHEKAEEKNKVTESGNQLVWTFPGIQSNPNRKSNYCNSCETPEMKFNLFICTWVL